MKTALNMDASLRRLSHKVGAAMNARIQKSVILISSLLVLQLPCFAQDFSEFLAAFNSSDFKQAISTGEDFIKRYPKHAEARYYLARSYMKQGQAALAEAQLHTALSLDPGEEVRSNCIAALKEISQSNTAAASSASKLQGRAALPASAGMPASTNSQATKGVSTYLSPGPKASSLPPNSASVGSAGQAQSGISTQKRLQKN